MAESSTPKERHFIVQKYKPYDSFSIRRSHSIYDQPSIYNLMFRRDYELYREFDIEGEKIKNYTKYVEKYLEDYYRERDEGGYQGEYDRNPEDYIYVWYVRRAQRLLDAKTLIIFRKKFSWRAQLKEKENKGDN